MRAVVSTPTMTPVTMIVTPAPITPAILYVKHLRLGCLQFVEDAVSGVDDGSPRPAGQRSQRRSTGQSKQTGEE